MWWRRPTRSAEGGTRAGFGGLSGRRPFMNAKTLGGIALIVLLVAAVAFAAGFRP